MNLKRTGKYYAHRIKRLQGDPLFLTGGATIGVFIGLTPLIPFHTLCIITLAFITRTSAIAGILISFVVCNPLTFLPIYYFSFIAGNQFTPYSVDWGTLQLAIAQLQSSTSITAQIHLLANLGHETITIMVIGGFIVATPIAAMSYFAFLRFFTQLKK